MQCIEAPRLSTRTLAGQAGTASEVRPQRRQSSNTACGLIEVRAGPRASRRSTLNQPRTKNGDQEQFGLHTSTSPEARATASSVPVLSNATHWMADGTKSTKRHRCTASAAASTTGAEAWSAAAAAAAARPRFVLPPAFLDTPFVTPAPPPLRAPAPFTARLDVVARRGALADAGRAGGAVVPLAFFGAGVLLVADARVRRRFGVAPGMLT